MSCHKLALSILLTVLSAHALQDGVREQDVTAPERSAPLRWHLMMLRPDTEMAATTATPAPAASAPATPADVTPATATNMAAEKATMTEEDQESTRAVDMQTIMNDCNETFRIEMEYITSLNDVGSFPDESDKTPKCYIRCVLEKSGVVGADGTFDAVRAADVFGGERGGRQMAGVEELASACAVRTETCKCERSYNFARCLIESEIMKYGN